MKPIDVIDKFGRKAHRANGILQDGDHMNVPLKLMDSKPNIDPRLEQAMRDAADTKRLEAFDIRHHRPGHYVPDTMPTADRLNHINAVSDAEKARADRIKRNNDAWKSPPAIIDQEDAAAYLVNDATNILRRQGSTNRTRISQPLISNRGPSNWRAFHI